MTPAVCLPNDTKVKRNLSELKDTSKSVTVNSKPNKKMKYLSGQKESYTLTARKRYMKKMLYVFDYIVYYLIDNNKKSCVDKSVITSCC